MKPVTERGLTALLRVSELDYHLPAELVARQPVEPRDRARLLVISRSEAASLRHAEVRDLPEILRAGDVLITNASKVLPARLIGVRADTGGGVEGLYLGPARDGSSEGKSSEPGVPGAGEGWRVLLKGRRLRAGLRVDLFDVRHPDGGSAGVSLELVERAGDDGEEGAWVVRAVGAGVRSGDTAVSILERLGGTPLPPYIRAARKRDAGALETVAGVGEGVEAPSERRARAASAREDAEDPARYQTVFADGRHPGSVAAPTAGLHFTEELLRRLTGAGIERASVVLHVGTGTFKPVASEYVQQHKMHSEWCAAPAEVGRAISRARAGGGRVVAVGTTSARTLESFSTVDLCGGSGCAGWTRLLIAPGHSWRHVDALFTNFHLPCSTLMAMVASFLDGSSGGSGDGARRLRRYYELAIHERYRFYSYGDAMLILP